MSAIYWVYNALFTMLVLHTIFKFCSIQESNRKLKNVKCCSFNIKYWLADIRSRNSIIPVFWLVCGRYQHSTARRLGYHPWHPLPLPLSSSQPLTHYIRVAGHCPASRLALRHERDDSIGWRQMAVYDVTSYVGASKTNHVACNNCLDGLVAEYMLFLVQLLLCTRCNSSTPGSLESQPQIMMTMWLKCDRDEDYM